MANQVMQNPAIAQLRDIHLPPPIGFWPIAPGWYFLLIILIACFYGLYRWYRRGRLKRLALTWLTRYEEQHKKEGNSQKMVLLISDLLRRVALIYFPRDSVAGLHGRQWLDFLARTSKNIDFNDIDFLFIELPYQRSEAHVDLSPLFLKSRAWIKQRGAYV